MGGITSSETNSEFLAIQQAWNDLKQKDCGCTLKRTYGKPKFCYKWLLLWKILMFLCYTIMFFYLLVAFIGSESGFGLLPFITFIFSEIILLICMLWYLRFIVRIFAINTLSYSPQKIKNQRLVLFTMEKWEWIISFAVMFPVFFLFFYPTACHIYGVKLSDAELNEFLTEEFPHILLTSAFIFAVNAVSIKDFSTEIKKQFNIITLKRWKTVSLQ